MVIDSSVHKNEKQLIVVNSINQAAIKNNLLIQ